MTTEVQQRQFDELTGLADGLARKMWMRSPQTIDLEVCMSDAQYGLWQAILEYPRYLKRKGFDFSDDWLRAYCVRRVIGAIQDGLRGNDWAPRTVREAESANERGELDEHGQGQLEKDLARKPVSIDELEMDLRGPTMPLDDQAICAKVAEITAEVVKNMDRRHQELMVLHYHRGRELKEIAVELGVSPQKTWSLHVEAILMVQEAIELEFGEMRLTG